MAEVKKSTADEESRTAELMKKYDGDKDDVLLQLHDDISFCEDLQHRKKLIKEYNALVDTINDERKKTIYRHL